MSEAGAETGRSQQNQEFLDTLFLDGGNAAYLEQGKGAACPDTASFSKALGDAEKNLQAAFPVAK